MCAFFQLYDSRVGVHVSLEKMSVYTIPVLVQHGPVGALLTAIIRLPLLICNGNPSANESGPFNLACIKR